jgi:hypothetical protein
MGPSRHAEDGGGCRKVSRTPWPLQASAVTQQCPARKALGQCLSQPRLQPRSCPWTIKEPAATRTALAHPAMGHAMNPHPRNCSPEQVRPVAAAEATTGRTLRRRPGAGLAPRCTVLGGSPARASTPRRRPPLAARRRAGQRSCGSPVAVELAQHRPPQGVHLVTPCRQ